MRRLKVVLIDDEMLIRKLIRMKMDTEGLDLEIVGEFSNGASAFQSIEELQPDIVVSDICMPEEDGISFSEKCSKKYSDIKIIIVTGYDDFDYACRSLKAGVFDYLMKPIQTEELNSTLKKASDKIRYMWKKREQQQCYLNEIKSNIPALRSIYLNQVLLEDTVDEEIEERLKRYDMALNPKEEAGLQIGILTMKESLKKADLAIQIWNEVEDFFKSDEYIFSVRDSWGRIIVMSNGAEVPFFECLDILQQLLESKYGCHMNLGISKHYEGWQDIRKAYLNALDDIKQKNRYKSTEGQSEDEWQLLTELIRDGRVEQAVKCFEKCTTNIDGTAGFFKKLCIDTETNSQKLCGRNELKNCRSEAEEMQWLKDMIQEMSMRKAIEADSEKGILIEKILQYMEGHMGNEELNMNILAGEFGISNSYLSRLLKQYTGKTYGELLADIRLRKMKGLLADSDMRSRDIGEQIGICDAHYLSIWFRKMTGYSVTEYRKIHCRCQNNETCSGNCAE